MNAPASWLRPLWTPEAAVALVVCFPPAGGHSSSFHTWSPSLPADLALAAVDPPGRGSRLAEPPVTDMLSYAVEVAAEIAALPPQRLILLGVSLGGIAAYETSRILLTAGRPVDTLCVVASRPPNTYRRSDRKITAEDARVFLTDADLTSSELMEHPEFNDVLLPAIFADLRLANRYDGQRAPRLPVPIVACCGTDDLISPLDVMRGWAALTSAGYTFDTVDGGHYVHQTAPDKVIAGCLMTRFTHHSPGSASARRASVSCQAGTTRS